MSLVVFFFWVKKLDSSEASNNSSFFSPHKLQYQFLSFSYKVVIELISVRLLFWQLIGEIDDMEFDFIFISLLF